MTADALPFPDTQEPPMPKPVPSNTQIGRSVRALREQAGWTQEQLADRMHERGIELHHSSVSTTELGKRALSFPEALALADIFDVHLDSLVDFERIEAERKLAALRQQQLELAEQARLLEAQLAGQ